MVVDGFWDYVAKVEEHYRKHVRVQTLVIPHFGSFSFKYHRGRKRVLDFKPSPEDWTIRGTSSSSWVDQWSGKPHGLSVRRRIAVFVAEQSGLPLKKVDAMLNQFLETVKEYTRKKATINWARRGTMRLGSKKSGKELYSFFASEGFLERLQVSPAHEYEAPKPKRKRSSSAKEWTMMDPEGYKGSKPPMPSSQKMTMKVSGCGCVMLPLIGAMIGSGHLFKLGVFMGFLYIVLLVKRGLCHRG